MSIFLICMSTASVIVVGTLFGDDVAIFYAAGVVVGILVMLIMAVGWMRDRDG